MERRYVSVVFYYKKYNGFYSDEYYYLTDQPLKYGDIVYVSANSDYCPYSRNIAQVRYCFDELDINERNKPWARNMKLINGKVEKINGEVVCLDGHGKKVHMSQYLIDCYNNVTYKKPGLFSRLKKKLFG